MRFPALPGSIRPAAAVRIVVPPMVTRHFAVVLLLLWTSPSLARAQVPVPRSRAATVRPYLDLGVTSIYDTNLERRHDGPAALGLQIRALAGLRASGRRLTGSFDYALGLNRFDAGGRWNWVSHTARAAFAARLGPVTLGATGEYLVGIASEDSEIGDQYGVLPRLELRLDDRNRLRVQVGQRKRRFGELGGEDADNRLIGLDYRIGRSGSATIELGSRFELNDTEDSRSRFRRWTHWLRFVAPLGSGTDLSLELRHYARVYPERFLHMESPDVLVDPDSAWPPGYRELQPGQLPQVIPWPDETLGRFPRHDLVWIPSVSVAWRVAGGLELELRYQYEARLSNDLRRDYGGHLITVGTRVRR
jgi:hypothetical protein